jgi:myxalamid-type nonribosomal peptide synthetase MxaA
MPSPLDRTEALTEAGRHQMLVEWNEPRPEYPLTGLLPDLVAARAAERPDAVALVAGREQVRYGELDAWAGRLAGALRNRGVGPEIIVGVLLERSPAMVAALLAIWRCGGAYLPLDPEHPPDRMAFILRDGLRGPGPRIVITEPSLAGRIPDLGIELFLWTEKGPSPEDPEPRSRLLPDHPAYVIYTSGSTGNPKGIAVSHRALANRILWACAAEVGAGDAFLHKTTLAFDVSLPEIFAPLAAGGRCVMAPPGAQRDLAALADLIAREGVTIASFPPSTLKLLLEVPGAAAKLRSLRVLVTGGEAVPPDLPARVRAVLPATLYNRYGPTETTVSVLSGACDGESRSGIVPMGRPIARARVYVLDEEMRLSPPGTSGEIYVGGLCLARGYLARPALTAERFVPDPLGGEPGERLYRTGDLARWRADGVLEFLGRIDHQVKIRGFRVEIGEVEAALNTFPGVREAAVVACDEGATGSRRLVAFVVPGQPAVLDGLRHHLAGRLADYMIPSTFVPCADLPRTLSGKLDRTALTERALRGFTAGGPRATARTELEHALAGLLAELLQAERIGVEDDFFELGCHSLLLMRFQVRLREIAGAEVPLSDVVRNPSVRALARFLEAGSPGIEVGAAELAADAALAPEIRPRLDRSALREMPETVLLTGATGFLGSHLLAELLERTPARVLCLVRVVDEEQGRHVLRRALERHGLWRERVNGERSTERIVPLPGDLGLPGLDLSRARLAELARSVDAIYHCGAQVNYAYPYETLRPANVEGTREILRLAVQGRAKALHHVSSLAVLEASPRPLPACAAPEEPLSLDARGVAGGYRQSKWVAERLVQAAIERGVPAAIYRPGWITGSRGTGATNPADFLIRLIAGSLRAGLAPELGPIEVCPTPVDWVGAGIVQLSLDRRSLGGVFHLVNPEPVDVEGVFELLGDLGHPLRQVPLHRWAAALAELAESGRCAPIEPLAGFLRQLGAEPVERTAGEGRFQPLRFASARTQALLANGSCGCPLIDRRLLEVYLSSLIAADGAAPHRAARQAPPSWSVSPPGPAPEPRAR